MDYMFSQHDLSFLDDVIPEKDKKKKEDEKRSSIGSDAEDVSVSSLLLLLSSHQLHSSPSPSHPRPAGTFSSVCSSMKYLTLPVKSFLNNRNSFFRPLCQHRWKLGCVPSSIFPFYQCFQHESDLPSVPSSSRIYWWASLSRCCDVTLFIQPVQLLPPDRQPS